MGLFFYRREVRRKAKDEPLLEGEDPKLKEVVETYWDCFNIDKVIRGHWTGEDEFTILLDDGHEQADDAQKPKFDKHGKVVGVEVKRERAWYMSQIPLNKEDAARFKEVSDIVNKAAVWEYMMRPDPYRNEARTFVVSEEEAKRLQTLY